MSKQRIIMEIKMSNENPEKKKNVFFLLSTQKWGNQNLYEGKEWKEKKFCNKWRTENQNNFRWRLYVGWINRMGGAFYLI